MKTKYLFEYTYSDGEWTLTGYQVIDAYSLRLACDDFENMNIKRFTEYEVFEIGKKVL